MQNSGKPDKQARRLGLMNDLCSNAYNIAMQSLDRDEDLNMLEVFEDALRDCITRVDYNKDDLATVWAMLQLGSRAIRNVSQSVDRFDLGSSFDPPTLAQDHTDGRSAH